MSKVAQTPLLKSDGFDYEHRKPNGDYTMMFCEEKILEFFDIPPDTEAIRLVAHDRPAANRVEIDFSKGRMHNPYPEETLDDADEIAVEVDGYETVFDGPTFRRASKLVKGKKVYVELEY